MEDISQNHKKADGKGRLRKQRTNGRLTPFDSDTTKMLIRVAEGLSKKVGINPSCVTKKMPQNISPTAYRDTLRIFEEAEERCAEANNFWFGVGETHDLCNPVDIDSVCNVTNSKEFGFEASDIRFILKEASRYINKVIDVDFEKSNNIYLGPGSACIFPTTPEQGYIRRTKSRIFKLSASSEGEKWLKPNPKYKSSNYFDDEISAYIDENLGQQCHVDLISQVPKSDDKNRPIGIGCVIGIASQHVCGDYIRKCLKRHGVDLDQLALQHKLHAYEGSVSGNISTIDFSSASDTISRSLVQLLFNNTKSSERVRNLYRLMDECRSVAYTVLDEQGKLNCNPIISSVVYSKFAPMGNCFTFELESLIFTALGKAIEKRLRFKRFLNGEPTKLDQVVINAIGTICSRTATSFGDDLCLFVGELTNPEVRWLAYIFSLLGLKMNAEKSFTSGPFRESCGADFYLGNYVRGFYFHKPLLDVTDMIRCINFFHLYHGIRIEEMVGMDEKFRAIFDQYKLWNYCVAPPKAGGVLDALLIVPSTFLVTDEYEPTNRYLSLSEVKNWDRGSQYGHPYYRCTRKGFEVRVQDLLVPSTQGILYPSCEDTLFRDDSTPDYKQLYGRLKVKRNTETIYISSDGIARFDVDPYMAYQKYSLKGFYIDPREPIVWDPGITLYTRVAGQLFQKNGWDRQPRTQLYTQLW